MATREHTQDRRLRFLSSLALARRRRDEGGEVRCPLYYYGALLRRQSGGGLKVELEVRVRLGARAPALFLPPGCHAQKEPLATPRSGPGMEGGAGGRPKRTRTDGEEAPPKKEIPRCPLLDRAPT